MQVGFIRDEVMITLTGAAGIKTAKSKQFRIKDRDHDLFIEQGISTSEYYVFGTTKCSVFMNLFKQLLNMNYVVI
jgi:hypothetical protein